MALTTVPILREDSIIAWDIEATFKGGGGASPWQSFGRVTEWNDIGPAKAVYREAVAGAGREAATIGVAGTAYPPTALGPLQVVDPRVMGFAWGQEVSAPAALGGGYYRHTATPTKNGRLPSMAVQMVDYKNSVAADGVDFLGVIMPKLSVRGEEVSEQGDESSGRIMMMPTLLAHDHNASFVAKTISLPTSTPYYKQHATIQFYNSDTDWRIHSWDFAINNQAKHNYYHTATTSGKPTEAPPEGALYDLNLDVIADGHVGGGGRSMRDILLDEVKGNAQIKYARTANQDEWAINLTDVQITDAPKRRSRGKVHYAVHAYPRTSSFEWVDQNVARYFPA